MAKENKPASAYAKPHTMSGEEVKVADFKYTAGARVMDKINPSIAGISKGNYKPEKTDGIKMRGAGAATKGTMCRGPMG